ncbi:cation diffusion facilitator family transporter [Alkalibacter mobilis]|uniref:cation diffusion facilitator family transporter n=1 Tax=Alkalibacter mobilis TaxID=2787712 RepID=UPI0018A08076|nr:cation diffusion facilitator family transporter [Alkalibacter mobilis]MBF7097197.1 cation diffusion facilitator family transporter [Alkalibacter mobilis]
MFTTKFSNENKILKFSTYSTLFFAISGILIGAYSGSHIIIFDGLYSLISVALSLMSLFATKFMFKKDNKRYPFGKDIAEPLTIIIKYSILIILVGYSFISALSTIFSGGSEISLGPALVYSVIGSFICLFVYVALRFISKKSNSALVKAESTQWFMDTLISFGVLAGFLISLVILYYFDSLTWLIPYFDSIMVIIMSIYFVKTPILEIKKSLREVFEMTPEGTISDEINNKVKIMESQYNIDESFVRIAKVGRTLWVEIDFVVNGSTKIKSISDQDKLRQEISDCINPRYKGNWLTVSFTNNRKWAV